MKRSLNRARTVAGNVRAPLGAPPDNFRHPGYLRHSPSAPGPRFRLLVLFRLRPGACGAFWVNRAFQASGGPRRSAVSELLAGDRNVPGRSPAPPERGGHVHPPPAGAAPGSILETSREDAPR